MTVTYTNPTTVPDTIPCTPPIITYNARIQKLPTTLL